MPRPPRADEAGAIYHALKRGNAGQTIFRKEEDYSAFERVIGAGLERFEVKLFSYQWMSNHWHMILSPQHDGEIAVVHESLSKLPVRFETCFLEKARKQKGVMMFFANAMRLKPRHWLQWLRPRVASPRRRLIILTVSACPSVDVIRTAVA